MSSSRSAGLPASASARSLALAASSSRPSPASRPAFSAWNSRYPSSSATSGSISASAASGPRTYRVATARFSSTTGEAVPSAEQSMAWSWSYSSRICGQSVWS